ncbi:hypothetical protein AVMA1855_14755 [Acidovorax sp. SUPP1855]|uniref:RHS repeat-associated core domain-containing protein n=1 Tax=Acidovorax sp. SUPP1855 TaxID=431774 RepID=UPI0023DE5812|nr:RHS repeat-associated core domain-containing protein [Acidovorax sp. SUPP1855]GKS85425.1 hypothetical protein AVMA1855_14755 [Acidovorax sp. SUPP1855]
MSYTYNALSQRVFKSDARLSGANNPAITQQTVYAEDGIGSTVLGQYGNRRSSNSAAPAGEMDSTEVIYLPTASGPMPVAAQINGRLYAIDADHLNTPRRLTNTQGQVVWQWLITGFGEANPTTGATGYAQSGQGATSYSEAVKFDLRYPGQVWDEETGLAYNLNRYYDREGGRYIQADPIGLDGGWNRFLYVGGNPASYSDPQGLQTVTWGPALPVIAVGCALTPGCRSALLESCGRALNDLSDWMFSDSRGKNTLEPGPNAGDSIPARGPGRDFTPGERDAINDIGDRLGCHTCGGDSPGTRTGNWVPDHQPPNALNPDDGPQRLYPHCLNCSRTQGGQIRGRQPR